MIDYLGKFLPQLSGVSEHFENLTKEQNKFIWSKEFPNWIGPNWD